MRRNSTSRSDHLTARILLALVPMSVLLGDTTANKAVNISEVTQTKTLRGPAAHPNSFRTDVTTNGLINSSDISTVKSKSGTGLPYA